MALCPSWNTQTRLGLFIAPTHRIWDWRWDEGSGCLCRSSKDGETEEVFRVEKKPNRFYYSEMRPTTGQGIICSVEPTHAGQVRGGWRLTSSLAQEVTPAPAPWTFMDVLQSWGNTWLWENISMAGGYNWLHEAITDSSLLAVTDDSYIRKLYPNLSSAAFVLECKKGQGRLIRSFSESLWVTNTYRGELLGLMAVHLILLSADKIHGSLVGSVEVVSDCLSALQRVTDLPAYRIPSHCKHSDILKNILVNCRMLSFMIHYLHVKAHQDDSTSFTNLSRQAQLNCICNNTAKQCIAIDGPGSGVSGACSRWNLLECSFRGRN